MSTPEECGVDDRAAAKLRTLPEEAQQEILNRLLEGLAAGNINNPSGFVVSQTIKAFKQSTAPSETAATWSAVEVSNGLESLGVDTEARALVQQLPLAAQNELLQQLQDLSANGNARNPSAWTARAANNWSRQKLGHQSLIPTRGVPLEIQLAAPFKSQPMPSFRNAAVVPFKTPALKGPMLSPEELGVDAPASQLLSTVPMDLQQQLLAELKDGLDKGVVQNPSGWIVKAARRRGAEPTPGAGPGGGGFAGGAPHNAGGGFAGGGAYVGAVGGFAGGAGHSVPSPEQLGVDERAAEMVRKLPPEAQKEVLGLLAQGLAAGNVTNPSGFVVKKAMLARTGGAAALRSAPY